MNPTNDEVVSIHYTCSQSIVSDVVQLLSQKYSKQTTFNISHKGELAKTIEQALRAKGFGVSEVEGIPLRIVVDDLYESTVFINMYFDEQRFIRAYREIDQRFQSVSPWSHYQS